MKFVLTEKQKAWLRKHYRRKKNVELCEKLGCSDTTLTRIARQMGLRKRDGTTLAELYRKERMRAGWGLPQRTRLCAFPVPREKVVLRWYLKKRGYSVDEQERVAYYTEQTKRCTRLEKKGNPWYRFEEFSM